MADVAVVNDIFTCLFQVLDQNHVANVLQACVLHISAS